MEHTETLFDKPKFRPGVTIREVDDAFDIDYREQGCAVSSTKRDSMSRLLNSLRQGGVPHAEILREHPDLATEIPGLFGEFDRLGLLTESDFSQKCVPLSGHQFGRKLRQMSAAMFSTAGSSTLYGLMSSGQVERAMLIGYAIEYFHIVRNAPKVIAPALAHQCPDAVFLELKHLFLDEHDHDKLLVSALQTVGIKEDALRGSTPLPGTFAVYSSLGTLARQHLLSFICALDLFEAPYPEFNDIFKSACEKCDLPSGFWEPIVRHAAINVDGEHHRITERLLSHYPAISDEEANVVGINTTVLLETILWQDQQICRHYGGNEVPRLRSF